MIVRILILALALTAAAGAQWREAALERIEKIRKGDIVVRVEGRNGKPVAGARVRLGMKKHDFGFGTAVGCQLITADTENAQRYRETIPKLFNKVVTENHLKWPFWETRGRATADEALNWFASKGIANVRGHCVIWPGKRNLPKDVAAMLDAQPVDKEALRARINQHIAEVATFAAAAGSILVSYVKARAEAQSFSTKEGLLTRAERYLVLGPSLLFNIPVIGVWIIAILANFTALQRIAVVRAQARLRPAGSFSRRNCSSKASTSAAPSRK